VYLEARAEYSTQTGHFWSCALELHAKALSILKEEVAASSAPHFRNRNEFNRE
jgi:hypothetical protein